MIFLSLWPVKIESDLLVRDQMAKEAENGV